MFYLPPINVKRHDGVTIIELMVIIAIAAIMVTASGYTFITSGQNQQGQQIAAQLAASLRYARSQAFLLGVGVSVCPAASTALTSCSTGATAWNNGWIVFVDFNNDGVINTSGGTDSILQVSPMGGKNPNITASIAGAFASYASFSTTGLPVANRQLDVAIIPTGCTGDYGRRVYVTASGRVTITNVSCP